MRCAPLGFFGCATIWQPLGKNSAATRSQGSWKVVTLLVRAFSSTASTPPLKKTNNSSDTKDQLSCNTMIRSSIKLALAFVALAPLEAVWSKHVHLTIHEDEYQQNRKLRRQTGEKKKEKPLQGQTQIETRSTNRNGGGNTQRAHHYGGGGVQQQHYKGSKSSKGGGGGGGNHYQMKDNGGGGGDGSYYGAGGGGSYYGNGGMGGGAGGYSHDTDDYHHGSGGGGGGGGHNGGYYGNGGSGGGGGNDPFSDDNCKFRSKKRMHDSKQQ
jgi:hypothetical protein